MAKRENFRELTPAEMTAKMSELKKKMKECRFASVMSQLENPMERRNVRRSIARLNTLITERECLASKVSN